MGLLLCCMKHDRTLQQQADRREAENRALSIELELWSVLERINCRRAKNLPRCPVDDRRKIRLEGLLQEITDMYPDIQKL